MAGANGTGAVAQSDAAIVNMVADPAASYWLMYGLRRGQTRDPRGAANDAALLARLLSDSIDAFLRALSVD